MLFTKEELKNSLLFKSKKSQKRALDETKVNKLLTLLAKRFGNAFSMQILTAKINQKCRDSTRHAEN